MRSVTFLNVDLVYRTAENIDRQMFFFFSSRRRHTRYWRDWSSDVCSFRSKGLQRRGVGAAGRLGDAERLQPQFAAGDLRQILCLLLVVAVPQHGAHGVHLGVAGASIAAGAVDFLEDRGGGGYLQTGAAVLL